MYRDLYTDALSLVSVGTDNKVRLWDVHEMTYVVCSLSPKHSSQLTETCAIAWQILVGINCAVPDVRHCVG